MHGSTKFIVCVFAAISLMACTSSEDKKLTPPDDSYVVESSEIAAGLTHYTMRSDSLKQNIYVVVADLTTDNLAVDLETSNDSLYGFETSSAIFNRLDQSGEKPLVAINADFWHADGAPVGMFVDDGIIWRGPWRGTGERTGKTRSVVAFDSTGHLYFGLPEFSLSLQLPDQSVIELSDINLAEADSTPRVYTYLGKVDSSVSAQLAHVRFSTPTTTWLPNQTIELSYVGEARTGQPVGSTEIVVALPRESVAIFAGQDAGSYRLSAVLKNLSSPVTGVVGGIPRLIDSIDGETVVDPVRFAEEEGIFAKFVTDLHPRTAIGYDVDEERLFLVVVDGRSESSVGMDLIQLANMFSQWGCEYAINFDGGGSTTMVVGGELINTPSDDTGERPVSNVLLIRER